MVLQRISPYDEDGRLVCHLHNVPAVIKTSHTVGNPNRDFYICPRRAQEGPENCGFFHWVDQLPPPPAAEDDIPPAAPYPPMRTPTNRPRHVTSHQSPFLPSPTSPTKRGSPFKADDEVRLKRLKTIKDAISSPGESVSAETGAQAKPPMSARAQRISQSISEALRAPKSPHRFTPDKDQVMSTPPSSKQFPKSYKLSDLDLDFDGTHPVISREDEDDEVDFSPSSSAEKVARSLLRSSDNTQTRGKRRAIEFDLDDDNDAQFWQSTSATATSQGNLFRQASPGPPIDSTAVASPATEVFELSGDNIERIIASTVNNLSGIPDYVHLLERKVVAMEKSNEFKVKRIRELEAENQKLKSHPGRWSPSR